MRTIILSILCILDYKFIYIVFVHVHYIKYNSNSVSNTTEFFSLNHFSFDNNLKLICHPIDILKQCVYAEIKAKN